MEETKTTNFNVKKVKKIFINKNFNVFQTIWHSFMKPMTFYTEESEKFEKTKNTFTYIGVIAIASSVISIVIAFIRALFTGKSCVWGYCVETSLGDRLANIGWWSLIWQNFLFPILVILALASIFYLGVLVAKKKMNYIKMVGLTAVSLLPYLVATILLSPILGSIWTQLGLIVTLTAGIYSLVLFFSYVRYETNFKDKSDSFMYYCLACSGVVAILVYLVVYQLFSSMFAGIL